MKARYGRLVMVALSSVIVAAGLVGCRDDEQGRPLAYSKGEYLGQPDAVLSDDTRDALRLRAQRQSYN